MSEGDIGSALADPQLPPGVAGIKKQ